MDALTRLHRSLAGGDDDEEQPEDSILGDTEGICSLSPVQRVYGFAACLVAGLALMILSLVVFIRPIKFAVMFTFGNILAVGSTAFLIGPSQQLRMMLDPVRVYATAIYGGFVFLALIFALWIHSKVLTLIAIICEICALFWYSLSYIPFARRMVSDLMRSPFSGHRESHSHERARARRGG
uniref:Vesicle transport protein n=1 Tax=Oryza meridionalis TaxID=40149 RepID=A0A0E0BZ36_9ORYZ